MKKQYLVYLALIVGVIIYLGYNKRQGTHPGLLYMRKGSSASMLTTAPQWSLKDYEGDVFNSKSLEGLVVLVEFWSTWCEYCFKEIPTLNRLQRDFRKKGFKVVGIALDDPEVTNLKNFVKVEGINYLVLQGDAKVAKKFGKIDVVPTFFLIGRDRKIIKYYKGTLPKDEIRTLIEESL